jgi:hypothetical protein
MNNADIERLNPDALAATLARMLPAQLVTMAQSNRSINTLIYNDHHYSGDIWRGAFSNLLGMGDAGASELYHIARSAYANESILRQVLRQRNVNDRVLEEVAGNQNVSAQLLSDIVGREEIGVGTLRNIARSAYANESMLGEVLRHRNADDSVLDEVARNEHATSEILLAIVRHGRLGVVEMEETYHEYDWQPGSARWRYETRIRTEIARLPTSAALNSVAQNRNATTDILMHIVQHPLAGANEGYGTLMRAAEHREADERVLRQILNDTFIEGSTLLAVATNRHVTQNMLLEILDHPRATYIVEEVNNLLSEMRAQERRASARGRGTALDDLNSTMGRMQLSSGPNYARPTYASNARRRAIAGRGNTSSRMLEDDPSYTPPSSYRGIQGDQSGHLPRNSTSMGGSPAHGGLSRGQFIGPSSASTLPHRHSHSSAHQPPVSSTLRGSYASTSAGNHLRNLDRAVAFRSSPKPNYRGGHHR